MRAFRDNPALRAAAWLLLLLNAGTLAASLLMLVGPSFLIARIHPAHSLRYE